MAKRKIELLVLSDIHLGTYGCRAKELVQYLKSVKPSMLILNGDIIDIWQFSKNYFPKSHIEVLKQLLKIAMSGVPIYYVTGNHDDALRRFSGFSLGNFHLVDKILLELDGKKAWFFHGDVFDASIQYSKWLAKLGGYGYSILILTNVLLNFILSKLGRDKMSFSRKIKNNVKKAVSYVNDFELSAAEIAIDRAYDYVVCGHIHNPQIRTIRNQKGTVTYLNSGDWIEHLSALEYRDGEWKIFTFEKEAVGTEKQPEKMPQYAPSPKELVKRVLDTSETVRYSAFFSPTNKK
ncbi:MAG: UDP-2,3-diacylglucosamine diphosphatase [Bacteroidota bacterium]